MSSVINISYEGKKTITLHDIDKTSFQLANIDTVIRSYHCISSNIPLIYTNEKDEIIVPSIRSGTIYVKRGKQIDTKSSSNLGDLIVNFLISSGGLILVLLTALSLVENSYINNIIDHITVTFGVTHHRKVFVEAWIGFVIWSTSNLFIRRLLNPETTKTAFTKYSADAFFGGIAQAAGIFLKAVLSSQLMQK
jgi:hypothetical protein